jgi:FemAB-related protein (PEP-CTERM system-associated)
VFDVTFPRPGPNLVMTSPDIQPAAASDGPAWDRYVASRPEANYCHRWAWKGVFETAYRKPCHYLKATEGGEWVGVLPLVHMRGRLSGDRLVSLPFLDQGGVVASSDAARLALGGAALERARSLGARAVDLRGTPFVDGDAPEETERFRFVLALPAGASAETELWGAIGGKVRNQVRKSERGGLSTRATSGDELERFYDVFTRNMRDLGSPVHSRRLFAEVLARFGPEATLYLTETADGAVVAGGLALRFRDTVVVPWASSLLSARPACPNHSLYWRVLRDVLAAGGRVFDFGRSSEGTGTYQFKKQWGADRIPLVWTAYDRDGRPEAGDVRLSAARNARLADLWGRLPLPLANLLGPMFRGRLPNCGSAAAPVRGSRGAPSAALCRGS